MLQEAFFVEYLDLASWFFQVLKAEEKGVPGLCPSPSFSPGLFCWVPLEEVAASPGTEATQFQKQWSGRTVKSFQKMPYLSALIKGTLIWNFSTPGELISQINAPSLLGNNRGKEGERRGKSILQLT